MPKNVYFNVLKCPEKTYYSHKQNLTISPDFLTLISLFLVSQGWQPCLYSPAQGVIALWLVLIAPTHEGMARLS